MLHRPPREALDDLFLSARRTALGRVISAPRRTLPRYSYSVTGNEETAAITHLRFSSGQDEVAPLTWVQRNMWEPMKWFGKEANQFNLGRTLVLPTSVRQDRVLAVLRCLIERYQTCRTHFVEHGNEPQQKLSASGVYEINVADDRASPEEASEDIVAAMRQDVFDHEAEWPLRIGYVIDRKRKVTAIALVGSHMAFDYWAIGRFISLLRGQLADEEGEVRCRGHPGWPHRIAAPRAGRPSSICGRQPPEPVGIAVLGARAARWHPPRCSTCLVRMSATFPLSATSWIPLR